MNSPAGPTDSLLDTQNMVIILQLFSDSTFIHLTVEGCTLYYYALVKVHTHSSYLGELGIRKYVGNVYRMPNPRPAMMNVPSNSYPETSTEKVMS